MKRILAYTLVLGCILFGQSKLMAQNDNPKYNTNQRISDQLKNGTAPGLRMGPKSRPSIQSDKSSKSDRESFNAKVKKGIGPNVAAGGGTARGRSSAFKKSSSPGNMASDQKSANTDRTAAPVAPKVDQGKEPSLHAEVPKVAPKKKE
ncbi:hypothetical protein HHL16_13440 [Pseudoflavitalea sp. G-6-1-2]|uniref:hypothetical protein n=1 Tax=Pseudoflavitalea sp. G-6-1-2 TaxID=2728841 RepID=UPI00146CC3A4|nr:hypothetical protein [Pseudoflavitalea sp. G-6-1-2]NML21888.1 hypothetical protein [Pseudoflavitalea sp. G-6-1-2]